MCRNCWEDYGSPSRTSPDIEHAADLIRRINQTEFVGLPLHVELDDWNLDGEWRVYEDAELEDESTWPVARELAALMNRLPVDDRAAAMGHAEGFTAPMRTGQ